MKSNILIITAMSAVLSATAGTAVFAQENKPFSGLYGGVEVGVDWTKRAGDADRDRSLYYGGVLGLREQTDSGTVFGIEGTFGDSRYENAALTLKSEYEWSTSLILGQTFGDGNNLLYGKAGYAQATFNPIGTPNDTFNDGGWRFGGGFERALSERISFRLGGDYTTYGNDIAQWQAKGGLLFKF